MKKDVHCFKSLFWSADICVDQMEDFKKEVSDTNHKIEGILTFVLIFIDIALLCVDAYVSDFWSLNCHVFGKYSYFHLILLIAPSIFLIISHKISKGDDDKNSIQSIVNTLLVGTVLITCALIASSNARINIQPFAYIAALFCIASLVLLNKYEMFIIYTASFSVYIIGLIIADIHIRQRLGNILFLAILNFLAMVITRIRYVSFLKEFRDNTIILEKNTQLKNLMTLLKATFDSIPDPIIVKNPELEILHVNRAAEKFYGKSVDEILGHKCYELRNRDAVCDKCILDDVLKKDQSVELIEEYNPETETWIEQRSYPVIDDNGHIIRIIDHLRDNTRQKNAEIELQRINSILSAQLEASLDGIVITDGNNRILSYNKRFISILDVPDSLLYDNDGERLKEFIVEGMVDREDFYKLIRFPYKDLPDKCYEKIRMRNNRALDVCSVPVVFSEYEARGSVWFFRDITDKEKMIEALQRSAEENERLLKESMEYDELKSEFFANISHEFRTPINVLLGIIQLMNTMKYDGISLENTEKNKRYLRIMKQNCYRLLRLTNNLIDMTKLDNGFFEANLKNCNIVQIIEDITLSVASYIENKGVCLMFDTDIEEKIMAVDPDKLERIMLNLLSNAVKFTERGGSIIVKMNDKGEGIEVSVKDTGIGIPEDKLSVIFERFRQVNSLLTREREGSGIGLSLTKNLVELLGGNIRATSKQGDGSEFIFWLPYRSVEAEALDKEELYKNQSQVERIHIEFSDIYSIQNSI